MGFKLNGAPYNKDNMNIAVYRKDLKDGSAGKSNHTGIIVDTNVDKETEEAVIAHETVHQHQQRNGELDYDKENFYWKGKTYPRENLNEHNENLPWEKEAYAKSNGILNGKQEDMKERFQLKGYRGNNKPFKTMSDRGLIGAQDDGASIKRKGKYISTQYTTPSEGLKVDPGKTSVEKGTFTSGKPASTHTMTTTYPGGKKDVKTTILSPAEDPTQTPMKEVVKGKSPTMDMSGYKNKTGSRVYQTGKLRKDKVMSKVNKSEGRGDSYVIDPKRRVEISNPVTRDKPIEGNETVKDETGKVLGTMKDQVIGKEKVNQPSKYSFTKYKGKAGMKAKTKTYIAREDQGNEYGKSYADKGVKVKSRKALERKTKRFTNYKANKIGQGDKQLAYGDGKSTLGKDKSGRKNTYAKREKALLEGTQGKKKIQKKRR